MNFSTSHIKNTLHGIAKKENNHLLIEAIKKNVFYAIASDNIGRTIYIGSMDDNMPMLFATLDEAKAENEEITNDYLSDIENGDRDEDDEWCGEVMKASLINQDEIAFYEVSGSYSDVPVVICKIKDSSGY